MTTGTREPSEEAITAAMAEKSYDGGIVTVGSAPSQDQIRSLIRNKLRAAYAIDFPDAWGDS